MMTVKVCFSSLLLLGLLSSALAFVPRQLVRTPRQQQRVQGRMQMALPQNALASLGLLLTASTGLYSPPSHASSLPSFSLNNQAFTSATLSKEVEVRQGMYGEYTVEKTGQQFENAEGTFKTKEETGENKNKYVAILAVLLIGSCVIPMAQYFWYVKDD
ncbi:hypothetical protein VYU27_006525 [Nannochloropsis oceanica]